MSGPANGTLVLNNDGTFEYIPDANFFGTDTFTYQLEDPDGAMSAVATVTITVNEVNDAPVANDDNFSTNEDTSLIGNILANDSDIDDSVADLVVTRLTDTANGTLTLNADGTFDYVPDADFFGTDTFTYQLEDANGGVSVVAVSYTHLTLPTKA